MTDQPFGDAVTDQPVRIPLQATLTLDLDGLWPHPTEALSDYVEDGPAPTTNRDELINAVAQQLADRLYREFFKDYEQRRRMAERIESIVGDLVVDAATKILHEEVQPTTAFGHPTGSAKPLVDHVAEVAAKWIESPELNRYKERVGTGSRLDNLIINEVSKVWSAELAGTIAAAKKRITDAVAEHAARDLAASMGDLAEEITAAKPDTTQPPTPTDPNEF